MDLMIDLETFGTGPRAVIASIGAVAFDRTAEPFKSPLEFQGEAFYKVVDIRSQPGREYSPDTIYFWMNQPDEARKAIIPGRITEREMNYGELTSLGSALNQLTEFCRVRKIEKIWCYGATFDHVILMDAYKDAKQKFPVSYRDLLDMRTYVYVMPKAERPTFGTTHNALDDAINQAIWMQKIHASMKDLIGEGGNFGSYPQVSPSQDR